MRKATLKIPIRDIFIGGDAPITVQSMTNTDTRDVKSTISQIDKLAAAGCEIVRLAIPDAGAAEAFGEIRKSCRIPMVADIHFDYRLALACMKAGADKIRINPGNIGSADKVAKVAAMAKERRIPIRIGVNSGSIEKDILEAAGGHATAEGMVESALRQIAILERHDFKDIVISLKSSQVNMTVDAYRMLSSKAAYPLHVGVTEAGTLYSGIIKSSIGIGSLLLDGIGDTIRVSLTADPVEEIKAGKAILKSLGLRKEGVEIISCPTCGRCRIDVAEIAGKIEDQLREYPGYLKVAIMGCAVNGPGEARECDIGIAGGEGCALLFRGGKVIRRIAEGDIVQELTKEIKKGFK